MNKANSETLQIIASYINRDKRNVDIDYYSKAADFLFCTRCMRGLVLSSFSNLSIIFDQMYKATEASKLSIYSEDDIKKLINKIEKHIECCEYESNNESNK